MFHRVSGAINARTFAVPDSKDTIDCLVRIRLDLLCAVNSGRSQVFVDSRQELHIGCIQQRLRAPKLLVVAPERRPAISTNEAGRVQSGTMVKCALH